jgi:hypothetical protein
MEGFDYLGAEPVAHIARPSFGRSAIALAAGAVGAMFVPKHRVLAFLDTAALAGNVHAIASGDRSWKDAFRRLGRHVVATAGSLALPAYPVMGYIAGAIAGDLLLDGEGGGIIEEWTEYEGVAPRRDVIDAEIVETKSNTALVKR